jgi:hypothetical protein
MSEQKSKRGRKRSEPGKKRIHCVTVRFTPLQIEVMAKRAGSERLPTFIHGTFFPEEKRIKDCK